MAISIGNMRHCNNPHTPHIYNSSKHKACPYCAENATMDVVKEQNTMIVSPYKPILWNGTDKHLAEINALIKNTEAQIQEVAGMKSDSTSDAQKRKNIPITTGVLDYFPLAIMEVAKCSKAGNDQHNPGQPLHWSKGKSMDHADALARHLLERGTFDSDGIRHSAKVAWRALALLQTEIENENTAQQQTQQT